MSQFSTYQKYSLANQLVQLEEAWKGIGNNQIYQTGQAVFWRYRSEKIRICNAGDSFISYEDREFNGNVYFENPTTFLVTRIWMYINGNGPYKYEASGNYHPYSANETVEFISPAFYPKNGGKEWYSYYISPAIFGKTSSQNILYTWDMQFEFISTSVIRNFQLNELQPN